MTQAADDYVKLCEESSRIPDVFEFVSTSDGLSVREKLDVVLVDQFHRWKHSQAIPVEHYLGRFPEFDDIHSVQLLIEEFGHLEERGVAPPASEFVGRYRSLEAEAYALLCEELDVDLSCEDRDSAVDSDESNDSKPDRMIGRYEVVCTIGSGAFGEVFLGRDPSLDRSVAIKVPSRERVELGRWYGDVTA